MNKKELYDEALQKEHTYYLNNKHEKVYIPAEGELIQGFIQRVLNLAKYEQSNNSLNSVVLNCVTNPFYDYALISFKIDSDDDFEYALNKYKKEFKKAKLDLFGGQ